MENEESLFELEAITMKSKIDIEEEEKSRKNSKFVYFAAASGTCKTYLFNFAELM